MSIGLRSCAAAAVALTAVGLTAPAAVASYTPLIFAPLTDPGDGSYYSSVADISADGRSYIGSTTNPMLGNQVLARYVADGVTYNQAGFGAAFALSANGQVAGGGVAVSGLFGNTPQQWRAQDAGAGQIVSTDFAVPGSPTLPDGRSFPGGVVRGLSSDGTIASVIGPTSGTWVITPDTVYDIRNAFADIELGASFGANRGMAADAPIVVGLVQIPSQGFGPGRYNYETGEAELLALPAGGTSAGTDTQGNQISADGTIIGGSFRIPSETPLDQPGYWDGDGVAHRVPGVGDRIWGDVIAVDPTGFFMGGSLFGAGLQREAFLFNRYTGESVNLNEVFADILPEGWVLQQTQHISADGERLFVRALAPDGTQRIVTLEGNPVIPAPGAVALFGLAGVSMRRRKRD